MEITVKHLDKVRFSIEARNHTIVSDQPAEYGGDDTGMTPPELLLAALGTCSAFYAAQFLKMRSLPSEGFEITIAAEKLKSPARLGNFRVQVNSHLALTEEQAKGLSHAVHQCLIHNTLTTPPEITIELTAPQQQFVS